MKNNGQTQTFRLRIVLENPLAGVAYALQLRDGSLHEPMSTSATQLVFEAVIRLGAPLADGSVNLLGDYVSGPTTERFVYINSGTRAGQMGSCWDRRAKVKLASMTPEMIQLATSENSAAIEGRIGGVSRDGGPCCASVPLMGSGWTLIR